MVEALPNLLKQNKSDNHSFEYFATSNAAAFQPKHKMDACVFGVASPKCKDSGEPTFNPFKSA